MKGVVLAGGFGTRMLPSTKVTNKHLLPVYTHDGAVPMIFYPIDTLVGSGISEILIISSREHCGHIIERLSDGRDFGADFTYKVQDTAHVPMGIASALRLARGFTGRDKFAVILGDNFFENRFVPSVADFERGNGEAWVFLKEVQDIQRFGCATLEGDKVVNIVEKPETPESNWAVTGLYFYTPEVYEVAESLIPSSRNELEITDINQHYCNRGTLIGRKLPGFWSDMGTPRSMLRTQEFIMENGFRL